MSSLAPTRLCLVRHGETSWNRERRLQGQLDTPLNVLGRQQAQRVAARLADLAGTAPFAALYSSDLERTRDTAQPIAERLALAVQLTPSLRERHFGQLQGLTPDQAAEQHPALQLAMQQRALDSDLGGGETLSTLAERLRRFLGHMLERHAGRQVIVVTHGGVLDVIRRLATGKTLDSPRDFTIPNAALNWISHDGQTWQLDDWADDRHLPQALDEI
ncbi:histidine phosphatase family protein [Crenobacter sp. SG2303]|uniref:Histidine phosphatase family protein n=1 Tax=Crenobacter oryzisoli TaxID=3056844 RepID=A0ABT7XNF6_9NEIS|nr:histidine phosphatase family protein [Crenobacter sp. SG2303]MDN0075331.1 histidine phosphatase family protein [Crenobacter sp. SG2303]